MNAAETSGEDGVRNPDPGGLTVTIHDDHVDLVITGGGRHTMPVGPSTIREAEFERRDPPPPACLTNALGTVHDHLDDIIIESPTIASTPSVVFVGHHADALAQVEFGDTHVPMPHLASRADIDEVFRTLVAESAADRLANPGLDADHVDTIIATCCVVLAIMRRLALGEATFATVRTSPTSTRSQEGETDMSLRHPSRPATPLRLYGKRVMLRPLVASDFREWSEVRRRNHEWLTVWEPSRPIHQADPVNDRSAFNGRCLQRDRDRSNGTAYQFGMFLDQHVAGEVNLNNVIRGAMQSGTIGYWVDQAEAGHGYVAEAVVVILQFALEQLGLHRAEICIVPRNERSRRVMEKLGVREEGLAQRYLEINGVWEDHIRYGMTVEEWHARRHELMANWVESAP